MNDGGALIISIFISIGIYYGIKSLILSIVLGLLLYVILGHTKVLCNKTEDRKRIKYIKKKGFKIREIIYKYEGDQRTVTIPFFDSLNQLLQKHNIDYKPFWIHMDKVIAYWMNINDESKKEFPHQIIYPGQKELLHKCWTQNSDHDELKRYLEMDDEYQWKNLPHHIKHMTDLDINGKIEWMTLYKYIQKFYRKVGTQLMKGNKEKPCDCYQPPRFYGGHYNEFENLEKMHYLTSGLL